MKRRARGFTLLELIVAIGIFAILALMAYGGLDSVLNSRRAVEQRLDRLAQLEKAYMLLRADFQQLRDRPIRDAFGDSQPAFMVSPKPLVVEFTRGGWRNPTFQPRSSQQRVSYRVTDGKLMRGNWIVLDRAQGAEPLETPLLDGVESADWRFLDAGGQWQSTWPPLSSLGQTDNAPPAAVELTLHTKDWGALRFLFPSGLDSLRGVCVRMSDGACVPPR